MIATDENALICDLAETYHIFDYKSLPLSKVATFCVGLRTDSRIKMKMNNVSYSLDTILLAAITDKLSILAWQNTNDATNGINRPKSILSQLLGEKDDNDVESFESPKEFERTWNSIINGGESQCLN